MPGISGYGECRCEDQNSIAELRALKPTILGMNPTQVDKVFAAVRNYGDPFGNPTDTPRDTGVEAARSQAAGQGPHVLRYAPAEHHLGHAVGRGHYMEELQPLVNAPGMTIFHPDQSTFGDMHETRRAAEWAHGKGVRSALHMSGSPFTFVCSLHIAAGIPDFVAMEHHYDDLSWYDSLVDGIPKPLMVNGYATVPDGPGLGIKPNEAAIRAHLTGGYFASLT